MTSPFSAYQGHTVYVAIDQGTERTYHREGTLVQYSDAWIEIDTGEHGGVIVLIPIARIIEVARKTR